jgi:transposase
MDPTAVPTHLFLAFELGEGRWKLGFSAGFATRVLKRQVPARDSEAVLREVARAKEHLGLPPTTPVRSCYEAGRDGFWLHRFLVTQGVENLVIDSSSIEVNRRRRRAKTDRLDLEGLVDLLLRYWAGSHKKPFSVVRVPSVAEEDRRHLHRELQSAKRDRTRVTNRMKGLLANHGLTLDLQRKGVLERLHALEQWDGSPLPTGLRARLEREWERVCFYTELIRTLQSERREMLRKAADPSTEQVLQLLALRGIGVNSAWLFVMEFFGWREFRNRKEVGALAAGDEQSGQPTRALDGGRDRVGLAPIPATEPTEPVVPRTLWIGKQADAQDRDRGARPEASDRALEVPRDRSAAGGSRAEDRDPELVETGTGGWCGRLAIAAGCPLDAAC